ncbi:TetR-like C-terminal domain-containing protein [Streptomyces sp. S1A(2023)]
MAGDEEDRRVSEEALQVLLDVLAGFGLPDARVVDSARAMRSALHGFVTLEGTNGFQMPRDVTRSFHFLIDTLIAGLKADPPDRAFEG